MAAEKSSSASGPAVDKAVDGAKGNESDVEKGPGPTPPADDDLYQPGAAKFWLIILCNFLAMFLVALDRTIVATAIPRITDDFNSLGDIGWYGSAYMLTISAMQLVFGRIYKLYDLKWTFLTSIVIFEVGSTICAAAPNSVAFIIGRAVAGAASAGIFTGAVLVIIPMVPLHKRPMFQSLFGLVFGISAVAGPIMGGALTSDVSWRWCFWINLPIGAFSFVLMVLFWNPSQSAHDRPKAEGEQQQQQGERTDDNNQGSNNKNKNKKKLPPVTEQIKNLDPLGIVCLVPSVVCLLLALQWGGSTYAWNDGRIIALLVLLVVLAAGFVLVQAFMPKTATVPARVICQRSVFFAATFTFFLAGSMLMMVYFISLWFQTVKSASPLTSGIDTLPILLALVAASFVGGFTTQKLGYYVPAMLVSAALLATGEGLLGTLQPASGSPQWIGFQFLAGFGLGLGMQTGGLAMQTVLPRPDVPAGIAVNMFAQQLGGAVFTSVGNNVLTNLLASQLDGVPGLSAAAVVDQGATALLQVVPPQFVPVVIGAYNYACTRVFFASMGLSLIALLCATGMEWRSIKKGKQGPAGKGPEAGPAAKSEGGPAPAQE